MYKLVFTISALVISACSLPGVQAETDISQYRTLEDTAWAAQAYALNDIWREIPEDANVTIFFDNGEFGGFAGCNTFAGTYIDDGRVLSLTLTGTSFQTCEDEVMQEEETFLLYLKEVTAYSFNDGNQLELGFQDGTYMVLSEI